MNRPTMPVDRFGAPLWQNPRLGAWFRRRRRLWVAVADGTAAATGLTVATALRLGTQREVVVTPRFILLLLLVIMVQLGVGWAAGLYRGWFRLGSFDELPPLAASAGMTTLATVVMDRALLRPASLGAVLGGGVVGLLIMFATRTGIRAMQERRLRPAPHGRCRVVIYGGGQGGVELVNSLMQDPASEFIPVAIIDDDTEKWGLRVKGVRVEGGQRDLPEIARRYEAEAVIVAISRADATLLRQVDELAAAASLDVKVLPTLGELLSGEAGVSDVRPLSLPDLLGRREIDIDMAAVAECVSGKRVLVTGAGGSIGSELCRQLQRWSPARMIMLDRDESALHAVQLSLSGRALLDDDTLVVADIRDRRRMEEVFALYRPEVVFHAAALKHLSLLEQHPAEAVKSNVWGTSHVLEAAARHGTARFINISTDKAADPCSVLGWSKRLGERLTASVAQRTSLPFVSVRFGNVLGSRGSVLTAFTVQVQSGLPLTVTHPDVTRFFMTVEEAVRLLLQAAVLGRPGEVLVLDMGKPVRIADVARKLLALAHRKEALVFTGLRPGEKLH